MQHQALNSMRWDVWQSEGKLHSIGRRILKAFSVWTDFTRVTAKGGVDIREECYWSYAWQRFKQSKGVKLDGILERKSLPKNAHCTSQPSKHLCASGPNPNTAESMVKTRTVHAPWSMWLLKPNSNKPWAV
jgi:hypothetical protein